MMELILSRNSAKIDKVTVARRTFDGTNAEPKLVMSRWQSLDNVSRFLPARGMLRWQRDELFFVDG